jgi:hypothetical protein
VCDSALLSGYVEDTKVLTPAIIKEVIEEREFNKRHEKPVVCTPYQGKTLDLPLVTADGASVRAETQTFCCPRCGQYANCKTKWVRGIRGEPQLCCSACEGYADCQESVKEIKSV